MGEVFFRSLAVDFMDCQLTKKFEGKAHKKQFALTCDTENVSEARCYKIVQKTFNVSDEGRIKCRHKRYDFLE